MDESEDWSELDQAKARDGIKRMINGMPIAGNDGYQDRLTALTKFRTLVADEIASGFGECLNCAVQTDYQTIDEAKEVVELVSRDLSSLGLAIKHPDSGEPVTLALSKIRHGAPEGGWFRLVPMAAESSTRPLRLASSFLPPLGLCEAPTVHSGQGRGYSR